MKLRKRLMSFATVLAITVLCTVTAFATPSKGTEDETPTPTPTPTEKETDEKSPATGENSNYIAAVLVAAGLSAAGVYTFSRKEAR